MDKVKIIFVCLGNICRSAMAEYMFRHLVEQHGVAEQFEVASAGTSREEQGNPIYPPAKAMLLQHGINPSAHRAHQITAEEYEEYDYVIVMERANIRQLQWRLSDTSKAQMLMDYVDGPHHGKDIADPWYTGNFQDTWDDLEEGLEAFLGHLIER